MIICQTKEVNSSGEYVKYNLVDTNTGAKVSMTATDMKNWLYSNPGYVVNLKLTRDGRIIDNSQVRAPKVIKSKEGIKQTSVNEQVLHVAKALACANYETMDPWGDTEGVMDFIRTNTGKKISSAKSISKGLIEAYYNLLVKKEYKYIEEIVSYIVKYPDSVKGHISDSNNAKEAFKVILNFGKKVGFSESTLNNLTSVVYEE